MHSINVEFNETTRAKEVLKVVDQEFVDMFTFAAFDCCVPCVETPGEFPSHWHFKKASPLATEFIRLFYTPMTKSAVYKDVADLTYEESIAKPTPTPTDATGADGAEAEDTTATETAAAWAANMKKLSKKANTGKGTAEDVLALRGRGTKQQKGKDRMQRPTKPRPCDTLSIWATPNRHKTFLEDVYHVYCTCDCLAEVKGFVLTKDNRLLVKMNVTAMIFNFVVTCQVLVDTTEYDVWSKLRPAVEVHILDRYQEHSDQNIAAQKLKAKALGRTEQGGPALGPTKAEIDSQSLVQDALRHLEGAKLGMYKDMIEDDAAMIRLEQYTKDFSLKSWGMHTVWLKLLSFMSEKVGECYVIDVTLAEVLTDIYGFLSDFCPANWLRMGVDLAKTCAQGQQLPQIFKSVFPTKLALVLFLKSRMVYAIMAVQACLGRNGARPSQDDVLHNLLDELSAPSVVDKLYPCDVRCQTCEEWVEFWMYLHRRAGPECTFDVADMLLERLPKAPTAETPPSADLSDATAGSGAKLKEELPIVKKEEAGKVEPVNSERNLASLMQCFDEGATLTDQGRDIQEASKKFDVTLTVTTLSILNLYLEEQLVSRTYLTPLTADKLNGISTDLSKKPEFTVKTELAGSMQLSFIGQVSQSPSGPGTYELCRVFGVPFYIHRPNNVLSAEMFAPAWAVKIVKDQPVLKVDAFHFNVPYPSYLVDQTPKLREATIACTVRYLTPISETLENLSEDAPGKLLLTRAHSDAFDGIKPDKKADKKDAPGLPESIMKSMGVHSALSAYHDELRAKRSAVSAGSAACVPKKARKAGCGPDPAAHLLR